VSDGLPAEVVCRVIGVSVSGFYMWRRRPPSARSVRHAMLAEVIKEVHLESRETYGARRVHAELTMGRGIVVARCTVELVMQRNGIAGLPGRPRYRKIPNLPTASDLVNRDFARTEPNRLWLTDITQHRTSWILAIVATLERSDCRWPDRSIAQKPNTSSSTCSIVAGRFGRQRGPLGFTRRRRIRGCVQPG
jgi:transposase InsO family protein